MSETRNWLITSTTYGTWLPGDPRGFVGRVWDVRPEDQTVETKRIEHDEFGTEYDRNLPGLLAASRAQMKGDPILLSADHAEVVLTQFRDTAKYRKWDLHAASVMANHFHLVVSAPATVRSDDAMGDFKQYASRAMNRKWGKPTNGSWWTISGSRRPLPDERAVAAAVRYVWNQNAVLARWVSEAFVFDRD